MCERSTTWPCSEYCQESKPPQPQHTVSHSYKEMPGPRSPLDSACSEARELDERTKPLTVFSLDLLVHVRIVGIRVLRLEQLLRCGRRRNGLVRARCELISARREARQVRQDAQPGELRVFGRRRRRRHESRRQRRRRRWRHGQRALHLTLGDRKPTFERGAHVQHRRYLGWGRGRRL